MLFSDEEFFEEDNSPIDNTQITTTILYFSEEELKEFKALCKEGMKLKYGEQAMEKGNISNYLLDLLRTAKEKWELFKK